MNPHKIKHHSLYWDFVEAAKNQSLSKVMKVGAVVVTPTGMVSPGWNGTPAGSDNICEDVTQWKIDEQTGQQRHPTKPEVIHAERNAIDKMTNQGIPTKGSLLFVSLSPCFECCKALHNLGLKAIIYENEYKDTSGFALLERAGTLILPIQHTARYSHIFDTDIA